VSTRPHSTLAIGGGTPTPRRAVTTETEGKRERERERVGKRKGDEKGIATETTSFTDDCRCRLGGNHDHGVAAVSCFLYFGVI